MFDHEKFDVYAFKDIPIEEQIYIIDEAYISDYEAQLVKFFNDGENYDPVGYLSWASVNYVNEYSAEISLTVNQWDRFHHVIISLPKDQFITCVGSWQTDEKPHIFVKTEWHETLYLRTYSVFALIDAANFKKGLEEGKVERDRLLKLRDEIDILAEEFKDSISFISFADSLLLKSNWTTANFRVKQKYTYSPEVFIDLSIRINRLYMDILGLSTYAIIAQGSNEYYDDPLLHISNSKNHICLNSLGVPFALLKDIEEAARTGIRNGIHPPCDLYMDRQFFYSLNFKLDKNLEPNNHYKSKMMSLPSDYYYSSFDRISMNLEK